MIPFANKKKILVTSALPYVNNIPHLGNLIGAVLSADVYARFSRSRGNETLYICGSDEHGTTTETKALEEGLSPKELCDKYHAKHKEIYEWFNISFDHYGRTSDKTQIKRTQEIFLDLHKKGLIVEDDLEQTYCEHDKKFLADRFVEGTCPHCKYEDARGDQCDSCGKLLNPKELNSPRCKICGNEPIIKSVRHLFLDLEALQPRLEAFAEERKDLWTQNALRTTKAWFKEGLKQRCITRDLDWGVHVPLKGWENKVFYVWFDAPIGYISITEQHLGEDYKKWWQEPKEVKLVQFMGKDNTPFHTILFPGMLLGTEKPWKMLDRISVTEYLNYEDGKFSKSRSTGVFGDDAKNTGFPADTFRYYLLKNRPETGDSVFSWHDFGEAINNELVGTLGNLINRTLVFVKRNFEGKIVEKPSINEEDKVFWEKVKKLEDKITQQLEQAELRAALFTIMEIAREGNAYYQASAPWKSIKENKEQAEASLYILTHLCKDLAILIEPYLPQTSTTLFTQLGLENKGWEELGALDLDGHTIGEPAHLFRKVETNALDELKTRFAGEKDQQEEENDPRSLLDLRVAKIERVEKHSDADKLYIEQVDLGPLGKRQIISGLAGHYTPEELQGKNIIIVANLKEAKLRGQLSQGMLLAAENKKGDVAVLEAPENAPGEQASFDGVQMHTPKEIDIKTFAQIKILADEKGVHSKGAQLLVEGKRVRVDKGLQGKIS